MNPSSRNPNAPLRAGARRLVGAIFAVWTTLAGATGYELVRGPGPTPDTDLRWVSFRRFASAEGLPQNTVYALAQDRAGFVYAGTEEGLARYDGQRWRRIAFADDVAAQRPYVTQLAAAPDGALWIGTDRDGLFVYRDEALHAVALAGPAAAPDIEAIRADGEHGVWVGTSRGLFLCDARRCAEIEAARGLQVAVLEPVETAAGTSLYVGTNLDGLYRIDDAYAHAHRADWHLGRADGLPNDAVRALASFGGDGGGDLWIGTGRGLARRTRDRLVVYGEAEGLPAGGVSALLPTRAADGTPVLIASLYFGGLAEFREDGRWRLTNSANGLPDNSVYALLETDRDRHPPVLWAATGHSGVARREFGSWSAFDERNGLPHRVVLGIGEARFLDGHDSIWIGSLAGSVRWNGESWQIWLPERYARRVVFRVVRDGDHLWVATRGGLLRVGANEVREYTVDNSALPGETVIALHLQTAGDAAGTLWVGTHHGIARVRGDRLEREAVPGTDADLFVRVILDTREGDDAGVLWAGTDNGLWYRRAGRWHRSDDACIGDASIMDLRESGAPGRRHALWVAARDGLRRIDLDAGFACTRLDARVLPPAMVYQIQFDRRGRLYAFGVDGVTRLTPDARATGGYAVERFGIADGLPGLEFNRASLVDSHGRVWGGGTEGVALYDPEQEMPPAPPRPLRLLGAREETSGRALHDGDDLPWQESSVSFDVSLLSYQRDQRTRYRAELVGLDAPAEDWSESGHRSYSRLPPGDYEFRAVARDGDGVVAAPITFRFHVHAPWWRRGWALALYAAALVAFGLGVGRLRARALAARARDLARQVEQRTRDLAEANRRLERASLTDPLTGLWNRRYFALEMPPECERARRRHALGEPASDLVLLLVDIDHFKRVNDRCGHAVGDAVLTEFARRLQRLMRGGDFAVRWGGEEFLLVLRDAERAAAAAFAARVRGAIGTEPFSIDARTIALTCSVGWAAFPPRGDAAATGSIERTIALADQALYRAKQAGRDRCCGALDDAAPPDGVRWVES